MYFKTKSVHLGMEQIRGSYQKQKFLWKQNNTCTFHCLRHYIGCILNHQYVFVERSGHRILRMLVYCSAAPVKSLKEDISSHKTSDGDTITDFQFHIHESTNTPGVIVVTTDCQCILLCNAIMKILHITCQTHKGNGYT